ncbi:hypothetical protein Pmani_035038 [Petrolisthes manimaculis]|uniref:Uncharacterized protein n=1 Tax=Petrolisthes manimaculis TaxID=1843537 RepID=A0AAE1TNK6_9EUCA|nr:hypothetical protein Pmani_035038 [Petrolisthes manimaculis]
MFPAKEVVTYDKDEMTSKRRGKSKKLYKEIPAGTEVIARQESEDQEGSYFSRGREETYDEADEQPCLFLEPEVKIKVEGEMQGMGKREEEKRIPVWQPEVMVKVESQDQSSIEEIKTIEAVKDEHMIMDIQVQEEDFY